MRLVWTEDGEERSLALSRGEIATLGRDPDCSARFANGTVSRKHAEIAPREGGWSLRALSRSSPTWQNGALLVGEAPLAAGDVIRLGVVELRAVRDETATDAETTPG